jgi:Bacteriophage head to tail connecting protein
MLNKIADMDEGELKMHMASVAMTLSQLFESYRRDRQDKEDTWLECWATYFGSPSAVAHLRARVGHLIGAVNDDWRHHISTAKGYEVVETIVAYLMGAFFPNKTWFSLLPEDPVMEESVPDIEKFLQYKLEEALFRSHFEMYVRQGVITGYSGIALPWARTTKKVTNRQKVKKPRSAIDPTPMDVWEPHTSEKVVYNNIKPEVIDSFDLYLDPLATDINEANLFRVIRKNLGELLTCIQQGMYPDLDMLNVLQKYGRGVGNNNSDLNTNKSSVSRFMGIEYNPDESIVLKEFWGSFMVDGHYYHDYVVTLLDNHIARMEPNPYWGGRPIVVGTFVPVPNRVYGLGALEPMLGMMHQLNSITNQRLDALELAVDATFTVVEDGVVDPEDVFMAPGKKILVGDHNSVRPVDKDTSFTVTYQEAGLLEQQIDQAAGTGAYIGTQQGRSGERVTATEIQAVRDAGGNRLSSIHAHMETTQLLVFMRKLVSYLGQFVDHDEIVRVPKQSLKPGESADSYEFVEVGMEELNHDWSVVVNGASFVAQRDKDLQMVLDFLAVAGQNPNWQDKINWPALLEVTVERFGFDNRLKNLVIMPEQTAPAPEEMTPGMTAPPESPEAMVNEFAAAAGGQPMQEVMKAQMAMQGALPTAAGLQQSLAGVTPETPQEPML